MHSVKVKGATAAAAPEANAPAADGNGVVSEHSICCINIIPAYSARTMSQVTVLKLSITEIERSAEQFKDMTISLKRVRDRLIKTEYPILDYQINRKSAKIGALLMEQEFDARRMFVDGVNKLKKVMKYKRKKAFKFNDLIAFLKKT